ncbi:MAG: hypothetical protein WDO71_14200 [Bacteroidota bacterium]
MYALRNLFDNMQSQDMPANEIKEMIPEIKNDLNYTVSLMGKFITMGEKPDAGTYSKGA